MIRTLLKKRPAKWAIAACAMLAAMGTHAQPSNVVFSDDFEDGTIDSTKWRSDDTPFESGTSDIQAYESNGALEFSGTVIEQWWPGVSLATVPTFNASLETNLVITVDRLSELGAGTASRSAMWITDPTRSHFVIFADVRGEGGWRYNRKIGENGDVPNGSGVDMGALNGDTFDDGGFHQMKVVANGETLKLYVDDVLGAEVAFPYTNNIVVELGSYARALNDTAFTQFDNFNVAEVPAISYSQEQISVRVDQDSSDITVRIPNGSNATQPVQVQVISGDPNIATPAGGVNGILTLTFPAGGATSQTFKVHGIKSGGTLFTLQNDQGLLMANQLAVTVPFKIGTILADDFNAALDLNKWEINPAGFESGTGGFTVDTSNGQLVISGSPEVQYWAGSSVKTKEAYAATEDLNLVVDVDRPSMERTGTSARSAVYLTTADRSKYIVFSQNNPEAAWAVNINPGNPTGAGTALTAFNSMNDLGAHHMKMIANGKTVSVYLDGVFGGTFNFPVSTGIYVELGGYARAQGDTATIHFDNFVLSGVLPCTQITPNDITTELGLSDPSFTVTIPKMLNEIDPATVTITSRNPAIAIPTGATGGSLKLTFAAGATNSQTVSVSTLSPGITTFDVVDDQGGCVSSSVSVTVSPALLTLISDDFSANTVDTTKWQVSEAGFGAGYLTNSTVTQTGGQVVFHVTPGSEDWPGITYATADTFTAKPEEPLTFEVDRVSHVGSGASTRTGVWITDATRANYVFFSYDDNDRGWQFNRKIGQSGDNPNSVGTNIDPLDAAQFNGPGNHRMKIVANGSTAKFYVDDVLGAEVPFPFSNGIRFEFGAFARSVRDVVDATFDNALLRGPMPCIFADVTSVTLENGGANAIVNVTIPRILNATKEAKVTVTSSNPSVATPVNGSNGALTLTYPAGGAVVQSFSIQRVAPGTAEFTLTNPDGVCVIENVHITSTAIATNLFTDGFAPGGPDATKWIQTSAPFETGDADTTLMLDNDQLEFTGVATSNYWGGDAIQTKDSFAASAVEPLTFEIDRTYQLDNGSTGVRGSVWILDSTGTNWIMFADLSENAIGWSYNRKIGQAGDKPTGGGLNIAAFDAPEFNDGGQHHLKLVANGSTVRFYVDGVFGVDVPFPFSSGLQFRIGAYVRAEGDLVNVGFDNASITGNIPTEAPEIGITKSGSQITLSWEGSATLEAADSVTGPWSTVQGANSPYSPTQLGSKKFYRLSR
jgi:hypothetical protein